MNLLLISIDSLNRHFLDVYGGTAEPRVATPNLDAFARRGTVFDTHYAGSLPCMPARREFLAGVEEFLWRPWGPIEPYDDTLARQARGAGYVTQLITEHFHYWQYGSHGYFEDFNAWQFFRGHEYDTWRSFPRSFPEAALRRIVTDQAEAADLESFENRVQYLRNTADFRSEEDWFAPKVFGAAASWVESAAEIEKWFLYVDSFEVHEPFDVPEPYRSMFTDEDPSDPTLIYWPRYGRIDEGRSELTERQVAYVRAQYAGKLAMVDRWFGRVMDAIDSAGLWDDTFIIVTTDHGHFLGEHGWMGKPMAPMYDVLAKTPLFIWDPEGTLAGGRVSALTQAIDIHATALEAMGVDSHSPHSRSLLPLLRGRSERHRDVALYGYWGRDMNLTDGRYTYHRAPRAGIESLRAYTTEMWDIEQWFWPPAIRAEAETSSVPYADGPVWRYPPRRAQRPTFAEPSDRTLLFDTAGDPEQQDDLSADGELERKFRALMTDALAELAAPDELHRRFAL